MTSDNELWNTRVERCAKLSREDKQKWLDLFKTGKTVGECNTAMGWDLALGSEVLNENIEPTYLLRREAK